METTVGLGCAVLVTAIGGFTLDSRSTWLAFLLRCSAFVLLVVVLVQSGLVGDVLSQVNGNLPPEELQCPGTTQYC